MTTESSAPSTLKKWIVAARPWSFPASTMPVIFGTSLAFVVGGVRLDVLRFLLALLAMVVLHSAANMLSDVFDFKRGLDTQVTPVSGAIVRGWLSTGGRDPRSDRPFRRRHRPGPSPGGPDRDRAADHRRLRRGRRRGIHPSQVQHPGRSGRLPEFRHSRRSGRLGRTDEVVFLDPGRLDRARWPCWSSASSTPTTGATRFRTASGKSGRSPRSWATRAHRPIMGCSSSVRWP